MAKKIRRRFVLLATTVLAISGLYGVASAATDDTRISGQVRDSSGKPQMGAVIEVFTAAASQPLRAFTDGKGFYAIKGLSPGTYYVKATADSFLPSLRENVSVKAGAQVLVNLTLNTLVEAFQLLPARKRADQPEDEWRWTLRSAANRPILRVLEEDGPLVVVSKSENENDRTLKARVAFIASGTGEGAGSNDMKTQFAMEQSLFSNGTMSFGGNLGGSAGFGSGAVRASYRHQFANGSNPEVAITLRRFATRDTALHHAALNALAVTMADGTTLGNFLELNYGGEMQSLQFRGKQSALRPFGGATAHLGKNTLLEYRYTTILPTMRAVKGFDTTPNDLTEAVPRVSLMNGLPQLEKARHQELALSRRLGNNNLQVAFFDDRIRRTALTGVGNVTGMFDDESLDGSDVLPDIHSGVFSFHGGDYSTMGGRVVAQRRFSDFLTGTVDYSYGSVLAARGENLAMDSSSSNDIFRSQYSHAVTGKMAGVIPKTHTRWLASYQWTGAKRALTKVDAFNVSAGQSDPYMNFFIRQPIPGTSFLPGKMEMLIDVRNLLAQGYIPMIGQDGRTLYLVQSPRSIRTGVAFSF